MSIINKMLRDLDQRPAPDQGTAAGNTMTMLRQGTTSMPYITNPQSSAEQSFGSKYAVLALGVVIGCSSPLWWMRTPGGAPQMQSAKTPATTPQTQASVQQPVPVAEATPPVDKATAVPTASVATTPGTAPAAAMVTTAALNAGTTTNPPARAMAVDNRSEASVAMTTQRQAEAVTVSGSINPNMVTGAPLRTDLIPQPLVLASTDDSPRKAKPAAATTEPAVVAQPSAQASRNALAQAQALWNSGAPDAATELLHQAIEVARQSAQSTPDSANKQALAALARELARMLLAQGRAAACLDMLAQLEPLLAEVPDIWAIRGNAAQRAGRHQESVTAYTAALQIRPHEPRWLLGAAVSSAALGQTANAGALANEAASAGPIPKDVQNYLRQLGVPLKD